MVPFERPALGANVGLGILYDARTDNFLSESALDADVVASTHHTANVSWQEQKVVVLCDSKERKFETLNLTHDLAASCLAGFVDYEGSGMFLSSPSSGSTGDGDIYHAVHFTTSTVRQEMDIDMFSSSRGLTQTAAQATHVVTQILFGGCCTVTATGCIRDEAERTRVLRNFTEASRIVEEADQRPVDLQTLSTIIDLVLDTQLSITCYSDLAFRSTGRLTTASQIKQHLETMFGLNTPAGYGAALPLSYTLTPVNDIRGLRQSPDIVGQLESLDFRAIQHLTSTFDKASVSLGKHLARLEAHRTFVRTEDLLDCHKTIAAVKSAQSSFNTGFSNILTSVRGNTADYSTVKQFLEEFSTGPLSATRLSSVMTYSSGKMDLIDELCGKGAICVNYHERESHTKSARHVFYFSDLALRHPSWERNLELTMQLLEGRSLPFIAIDCDTGTSLAKPRVSQYDSGKLIIDDMVEQRAREASLCFVQFDRGSIDVKIKDTPAQHKSVRLPCPGQGCGRDPHDWVCVQCRSKIEFGVVDSFFYCDCGRAHIDSASYNCQQGHGMAFTKFPQWELRDLLQRLPTPSETNILILGETGVGKSTFINAFINYLSFESLDDALAAKNLNYIIPCSFSTQTVGASGKLIQSEVRIGRDDDEHDGSRGQSATQESNVYLVHHTTGTVRLIDTPGIGDTRGKDMDEQNMRKILQVLRNYDKLHGILILLRPNNARLTILFKYCIEELLTQLHRTAAKNMVFGFTNTRGSNYKPGDTFKPLETLLSKHKDVIPGLFEHTVYCFDSESFRYLAARHQGVDMGHIDDYRNSWNYSAKEAHRLVDYFQSRVPHEVRNTVSLNETRHLIAELVGPMARITSAIADTVRKGDKQISDLQDTQLKGKNLAAKLMMTKVIIDSRPLDKPRTVCTNSKCCSYSTNHDSDGATVTIFKSRCHDPCSLKDVPPDVVGAQQIPPCAAFDGHEECQVCGHHWQQHQHIMIEYSERTETTTDPSVERALHSNEDEATAKKAQIAALKKLKKELLGEHETIQKSQARFRFYLDQHSMTLYNDATIEYYEHLIKDEKTKVAHGGSRTRLEQMEQDMKNYQHFVNAMKSGNRRILDGPLDANGVYKLIRELYTMQHYGSNLKDCAKKTSEAYAATYRERSYRIRAGGTTELFTQSYAFNQNQNQNQNAQYGSPTRASQTPFTIFRRALSTLQPQSPPKQAQSDVEKSANLCKPSQHDSAYASPSAPSSHFPDHGDRADGFAFPSSSSRRDINVNVNVNHLYNIPADQPPAYNSGNELLDDQQTSGCQFGIQPAGFGDHVGRGVRNELFDAAEGLGAGKATVMVHRQGIRTGHVQEPGSMQIQEQGRGDLRRQKSKWFSSVKDKLKGRK